MYKKLSPKKHGYCTTHLKVFEQILLMGTKLRLIRRWLILHMPVRIKVLRIKWILNIGNPRSRNLLLQELLDIVYGYMQRLSEEEWLHLGE